MTITLDYRLSPQPGDRPAPDLVTATESDLRYSLFLGDVVFRVGEADFSANWGWVPVLDFALGLEYVVRELRQGKEGAEFDFTESESTIRFQRDEGDVFISASYAPHRTAVKLEDLVKAVRGFRKRVVDDLSLIHPQLRMNTAIRKLIDGQPVIHSSHTLINEPFRSTVWNARAAIKTGRKLEWSVRI